MQMIRSKRYRSGPRGPLVAMVAAGALAVGLFAVVPAIAQERLRYVALGDSSASGPVIPNQIDPTCGRSDHNWPHALATSLDADLTDVTCSGARIPDLAGQQVIGNTRVERQFKALTGDEDLVTLAIGANDIPLAEAFIECETKPARPTTRTCEQQSTVRGVDKYASRIATTARTLGTALDKIHDQSPRAAVVVVGYLTYWQPGGCFPDDPYTAADADYMQEKFDQLMAMLASQAAAHRATYVDIRTPSADHGLCAPAADRWLEGRSPAAAALAYHPNATGMAHAADIVAANLGPALNRT
jgi:lysophospholipase L1-like esterase